MGTVDVSRSMLRITLGILALWGVWGLVETLTDRFFLFYTFRSFGLISPLVGVLCLVFSVLGVQQARQLGATKRYALAAIVLSVAVGVVPFWAIPYDPS
jgi:ABC-type proline/glycine betaine transport system permease subunit